ncbi:MAG: DNA repair protein RecN [Candidatus Aquicultorales bacterium]
MLVELRIKNLALIEDLTIEFGPGLNVLTGETGAGKTVVVGAINLLIGGRADASLIRSGSETARVEGRFDTAGSALTDDLSELIEGDELIVVRVLSRDGKNKAYVNGTPVTLGFLQEAGSALIDLHGQHDQQSLFKVSKHLDFLDAYAGRPVSSLCDRCASLVGERSRTIAALRTAERDERDLLSRKDLLEFQVAEIEKADCIPDEDTQLEKERDLLSNLEKIATAVDAASASLVEDEGRSALDRLSQAQSALKAAGDHDAGLSGLSERLDACYFELEDCAREIKAYQDELVFPPGRLDEVHARLSELALLKRKYGEGITEVLAYKDKAKAELEALLDDGDRRERLEIKLQEIEAELALVAAELSEKRSEAALRLQRAVDRELGELGMAGAGFKVANNPKRGEDGVLVGDERLLVDAHGADRIEFCISANPGEPDKPLIKIGSGGEISRVMLALKLVLRGLDPVPSLVFDEIDSGIGGATAGVIGEKLAGVATAHQVFVVTHLAQIARFAEHHYLVEKVGEGRRVVTKVRKLDEDARISEIARMLSGEMDSQTAVRHAEELLANARRALSVSGV